MAGVREEPPGPVTEGSTAPARQPRQQRSVGGCARPWNLPAPAEGQRRCLQGRGLPAGAVAPSPLTSCHGSRGSFWLSALGHVMTLGAQHLC